MKKKLWVLIVSMLAACCLMGACGGGGESSSSSKPDSVPGSAWEDESITDQEHSEIELPEVERP